MIKYKQGDILKALEVGEIDIFGHGCNCVGGFGSGIAGQIKKKYPEVREAYSEKYDIEGCRLGEVQMVKTRDGIIANCMTQYKYYPRTVLNADYTAIHKVCEFLKSKCEERGYRLGLPKIGCGLAGGSWYIVKAIIEDVFKDSDVEVTIYEYSG